MTSLLLSEHYLQASGQPLAAVTRTFLATAEALCLDANVAAAVTRRNHHLGEQRVGYTTGSAKGGISSKSDVDQPVSVESVLHEMVQTTRRKRRRRLRGRKKQGQRQRHLPYRKEESSVLTDTSLEDDQDYHMDNDRESWEGGAKSVSLSGSESGEKGESTPRLALAASVATLDGLLGCCVGITYHSCRTAGDGSRKDAVDSSSSKVGSHPQNMSVFRSAQKLGLSLVLVQSTEDALVGTPLPLLLQKEVRSDDTVFRSTYTFLQLILPAVEGLALELSVINVQQQLTNGATDSAISGVRGSKLPEAQRFLHPGISSAPIHVCWMSLLSVMYSSKHEKSVMKTINS